MNGYSCGSSEMEQNHPGFRPLKWDIKKQQEARSVKQESAGLGKCPMLQDVIYIYIMIYSVYIYIL